MKAHDHVCPWWLAYSFDNPIRRLLHNPLKMFCSYVQPGMHVADIGCGMGFFSIGLAGMVGENGKVYSIDIQQKMLDILMKRAGRRKVNHLIHPRIAGAEQLNLPKELDFILGSWMVHETKDIHRFSNQIYESLKPGGIFYMTEPKMHVSNDQFDTEIAAVTKTSLQIKARPTVALSHAVVFEKGFSRTAS